MPLMMMMMTVNACVKSSSTLTWIPSSSQAFSACASSSSVPKKRTWAHSGYVGSVRFARTLACGLRFRPSSSCFVLSFDDAMHMTDDLGSEALEEERDDEDLSQKEKKSATDLTLELLQWPSVLGILSSFAGTSSAKEIIQGSKLPFTQRESENLLLETTAGIDLLALLGSSLGFAGVQSKLVNSCIIRLQKGFVITGKEALAILMLFQFTDTIRHDIKMGMEQKLLSNNVLDIFLETICTLGSAPEVTKSIMKTVDEDGNVKDSASAELQQARAQYRLLQTKVQELLRGIVKGQEADVRTQEVDGRYCIVVSSENQSAFPGLLLQSGVGGSTSYIEPVALVSMNDKLAEARASILKAEYEALKILTKKLLPHVENIAVVLEAVVKLDVIVARAKFSLRYHGSKPNFTTREESSSGDGTISAISPDGLLIQLKQEVTTSLSPPVPIDISVGQEIRVVTITGPNTGGKTAAMKTLGLASLMAKFGLYVLAKDPVYLPWFDAVFADIGDEQSLSQSLSTFSGHLRRINRIKESSTGRSLVLLDEVGTGTNPTEGAALGMAVLESFAGDVGGSARLTLASTHHAELKTLKYSDRRFENASVEFDEETLKPTYRLLWGIPGRSNALNISQRLGVPKQILQTARKQIGAGTTEINQVIMELEKFKREFENNLFETEQYLMKAKMLHASLEEAVDLMQAEEESSSLGASGLLQEVAHKARAALTNIHLKKLQRAGNNSPRTPPEGSLSSASPGGSATLQISRRKDRSGQMPSSDARKDGTGPPQVGEIVRVPKLGKDAKVVQVLIAKKTVVVQSGSIQLKLSFADVDRRR